ncbi:MAG TPA: DUF928 domain-containing protein [Burkholderiales bacterium]|nr:DUF928 domain-containing protein [Burkholderiales bacterium]
MSKSRAITMLPVMALVITLPLHGLAQEKRETPQPPPAAEPAKPPAASASSAVPVYKPPLRGAPGGRVGGGTRGLGAGRAVFVLSVLAPDHTGLTVSEQPTLYWFISSKAPSPVELTVVDPRATKPLMEVRLSSPVEAGVHRIRLADHNVRLEPGVAYRWYVAVVPDANRRARDFLTGGAIERIEPSAELRARLAKAGKAEAPALYAEAGLWYDAIAALSALIESAPGDAALRRQRAAMLAQVGLPEITD